jgi:hypothetical protein
MRLSEWRNTAPSEDVLDERVLAVIVPVLIDLGAEPDPDCWVAWGEDPTMRYAILAPTPAGMVSLGVRFNNAEEGPRAVAKLIRWSKLGLSELAIEAGGGHRVVAVQVENMVLKGMDEEADRICEFVLRLIAGVEDRLAGPVTVVGSVSASTAMVPVAAAAASKSPKAARSESAKAGSAVAKSSPAAPAPASPAAKPEPVKADQPAATPASVTAPSPAPEAAAAATESAEAAAPSVPPTPLAMRAAARLAPASETAGGTEAAPGAPPEPQPDRAQWSGPHAIDQQPAPPEPPAPPSDAPKKPRWMP